MKVLQKPWFLALLCALVICGTILVNTRVGLGRAAGKVTQQLYSDKNSAAAEVLKTVRTGVSALGAIADQSEIDSAVQSIDQALALLDSSASIGSQLTAYCEALDLPIALAKLQGIDASEAEQALAELNAAISSRADAETLQSRYTAAQRAGDSLLTALGSSDLSDSQRERVAELSELLQSIRRSIAGSGYNQAVYSFLSRYSDGYTRLCANLAGVKYPQLIG